MRLLSTVLASFVLSTFLRAAAPTSEPTELWQALAQGEVRYTIPDWWELKSRAEDGLSANYKTGDEMGSLTIGMTLQKVPIADTSGNRMRLGNMILKSIKDDLDKKGVEYVEQPKLQKDERFLVSIKEEVRYQGSVLRQIHIYKQIGYYLVFVTVGAGTENQAQADEILKAGEQVLEGALSGKRGGKLPEGPATRRAAAPMPDRSRHKTAPLETVGESSIKSEGPKVTTFRKAGIAITPPAEWKVIAADTDEGLLATYRHPTDASQRITIHVRRFSPGDGSSRDSIAQEMATEDTRIGKPVATEPDKRFLKKTRSEYEKDGVKLQIASRQVAVGNLMVSIASTSPPEKAEDVTRLADDLAAGIRTSGQPTP
jgi:hypothetical protein